MKILFHSLSVTLLLLGGVVLPTSGALLRMDILPDVQVTEPTGQINTRLRSKISVAESISFPHEFEIDPAHDVLVFKNESTGKSIGIKYSNAQDAVEITPLLWGELTHAELGEAAQFSWSYGSITNQRLKAQAAWRSFVPSVASISSVTLPSFRFKENGVVRSTGTTNRTLVAISKDIPVEYMTLPGAVASGPPDTGKMAYTYELPDGRVSTIVSSGGALPLSSLTVNVNEGTLPFSIVYDDSYGEGFRDVTYGAERRAAMEYAVSIWAGQLYGTVPVEIHVSIDSLGEGVLGQAGPLAWGVSEPQDTEFDHVDTVYVSSLANQLLGFDFWPDDGDASIRFSTDYIDEFYFGLDGNVPAGKEYDFVTIVIHELAHGLGFLDGMDFDGSYWDQSGVPFVFDHHLYYNGHSVVDLSQNGREVAITSEALFWDGSYAKAANGGARIEMYAPSSYDSGSSTSHWDLEIPFRSFMEPRYFDAIHAIDPQLLGALWDMEWKAGYSFNGWTVTENIPEGQRGPLDMPAGDGIANIWKFAIGLNAMTSHTQNDLFTYASDAVEEKFSIIYKTAKLRPEVEVSPEWTSTLRYNGWDTNGITTIKIGETVDQETWESTIPVDTKAFIRLRVELQ